MVKPVDTVPVDPSLITVAFDKASMEIPFSHAEVVKDIRVKVGDKVQQCSVVLALKVAGAGTAPTGLAFNGIHKNRL